MRLDALLRVSEGGENEILEYFDLVRIDERLVDLDLAHLALAGERHLDEATARSARHLDLIEARLHLRHARLHLLRLLHHLAEIFHRDSSPSPDSSALSVAPATSAATISRTASIRAPGKISSTLRTSGCCAASFRRDAS